MSPVPDVPVPVDCRRSYTSRTAMEPSPMAAAARLTEPLRTSPAAKIPGLLVSRNNGAPLSWASRAAGISLPVSRNPSLSWASWPASHSVLGFAPMKTNSPDGQIRLCGLARAADPHGLQLIGPDHRGDLRSGRDDDAGLPFDPVHQVTRHRRVKRAI